MAAAGPPRSPRDRRGGTTVRSGSAGTGARRRPSPPPRAPQPPKTPLQSQTRPSAVRPGPTRPSPARPPGPGAAGSVSLTSAERFAAKVRRRRQRQLLIALGILVVLVIAAWAALGSSWSTVQTVEVTGTDRVDAAQVTAAGEREQGQPLLLARVSQVRAEVARNPLVLRVTVTRHWPSTLRIHVVEREPVAAVAVARQGDAPKQPKGRASADLRLVDQDGVTIETVGKAEIPAGMPTFAVDVAAQRGVPALRACLAVSSSLPPALKSQVAAMGASSPDGVWLDLRSGARVQWGDDSQGRLKAEVLTALLKQKATAYDIRAPETPAVRLK